MDRKDQKIDDHEAEMARSQLYKLAKYSAKLFNEIKEGEELEGWVQAKITKASDYVSSVYHHLEYQRMAESKKSVKPTVYKEDLQESIKKDLRKNWSKCKKG